MRIDPALFVPGANAAPASGAKAATPFAQMLDADGQAITAAGLAPALATTPLPSRPAAVAPALPSDDGREPRPAPVQAFAFGALGVFAPARADEGEVGAEPPAAAGLAGALEAPGLDADAARPASPAAATQVSAAPGARDVVSGESGLRPDAPRGRPAERSGMALAAEVRTPLAGEAEDEPAAIGAAPRPPTPTPRRTPAASLTVAETDAGLSVVAAAPGFEPIDYAEAHARLAAAAADLGASLDDLHINGQAGPPAKGGPRHGHRAR